MTQPWPISNLIETFVEPLGKDSLSCAKDQVRVELLRKILLSVRPVERSSEPEGRKRQISNDIF